MPNDSRSVRLYRRLIELYPDLLFRLRAVFRRRSVEKELDDELRFHLENEIEKLMRSGLTREEASSKAKMSLGGLDQVKEECRDSRGVSGLENALQDIRYGMRGLRPLIFAVISVLPLGLLNLQTQEAPNRGVITGRVTDPEGKPSVEEPITIYKFNAAGRAAMFFVGQNSDMYRTDDRGVYRLHGLPPGRYLVSAGYIPDDGTVRYSTPRAYYPCTFYPDVTDQKKAKALELDRTTEVAGVDITLASRQRSFDITGRAINAETGKPVAGLEISFGPVSAEGGDIGYQGESEENTEADGRFVLPRAAPGKYAVYVSRTGETDYYSQPTICEVVDRDVADVDVRASEGGSIRGKIVVEGITDRSFFTSVELSYRSLTPEQQSFPYRPVNKFDPDGGFRIRGIPPGRVAITPNSYSSANSVMLKRIERNGAPVNDGFEITAGGEITGVRLIFSYGNLSLRGQLKLVGEASLAKGPWYVQADPVEKPPQDLRLLTTVDQTGAFTLNHLSPGEYDLLVLPSQLDNPRILRAALAFKHRVVVTGNDEPVTLTFVPAKEEAK